MPSTTTSKFGKAIPVFRVADVSASVKYYEGALGYETAPWSNGSFASVMRGDCNIFLTSDSQSQPRMWTWVGIEGNLRELHAEFERSGAKVRNPPSNFEWALEMQIEDLDGNVIRFGSDPEYDEPLGVFLDADGVRWRHLGNDKYERVE